MPQLHIFYHLFAVQGWQTTWRLHRNDLLASGAYDRCETLRVGAVYGDAAQVDEVHGAMDELPKASLLFERRLEDVPPFGWPSSTVRPRTGRVAEAETIWGLVGHAQTQAPETIYLFLHTKGVTNPSWRTRKILPYFLAQGCPGSTDEEVNGFVLQHLRNVVLDWREHIGSLETHDFHYRLFNFFWVRAALLHQFDLRTYLDWHATAAPPAQRRHRLDGNADAIRHLFALFPLKLFACAKGLTLELPHYEYVDVSM